MIPTDVVGRLTQECGVRDTIVMYDWDGKSYVQMGDDAAPKCMPIFFDPELKW